MVSALALAGCTSGDSVVVNTPDAESSTSALAPETSGSTDPDASTNGYSGFWAVADAQPETLATGLESPWSVIPYRDGYLVSQRDDGEIVYVDADGSQTAIGEVEGVVSGGESGLHGLALLDDGGQTYLYAYHGAEDDNRVVRMTLDELELGASESIVTGIPRANTHNGGRIHFGPDGYLYISTGDAQQRHAAQDRDSLAGKILRVDAEGNAAPDNPFDNLVYSLGHRNVQGFAWTSDGIMWASEFGQNTWDELNVIEAGGNYGWPTVEGIAGEEGFIDPRIQWSPSEASPSGMAAKGDTLFLATLRGQQLWVIDTAAGEVGGKPVEFVPEGVPARIRDAGIDSDGSLLILTNNTDGRGSPSDEDDRLLRIELTEA
ncbi:PQQ-dependent sugar dehydrogenase [Gulosibacter chungangensis]|uniref:PQQ-dependent sugar dehydrogenase n=2 Tax=Gulosibacter chungangensis TaxID=979746 RepID=A0A7J5BGJ3_9MICO|nr:PQQ-dependent sugar dehydrogenase [Gulosibacter chungangensis]